MAASAWQVHDGWFLSLHKGDADIDTDTFAIRLYTSASNIATESINAVASVTNELSTAFGYVAGGDTVVVTGSQTSGVFTLDCEDAIWTATGGDITARYAGLIDVTAGLVVAHTLLDTTPADVTASDGNTFTVQINALGVYSTAQV